MKHYRFIILLLSLTLLLSGCKVSNNNFNNGDGTVSDNSGTSAGTPADTDFSSTDEDMFSNRDMKTDYDTDSAALITLNGTSASCSSDAVSITGSTITLKDGGTYIVSGTLSDGMIIVNAGENDKLQIVLNGVSITSNTSAPLYILSGDKVFVTLASGTENTLENCGSFTAIDDNNIDGAVFSKQDLTFNGGGMLTVISPAGHGIVCKDDLVFTGGTYTVNSASHGIDANDSVRIANASVTIDAGKDGIHAENSDDANLGFVYISSGALSIEAEGDGISAYAYAQIKNGTFNIRSGGGSENGEAHSSENYGGFMGGGSGGRPGQRQTADNYTSETTANDESTSMKGIKATGSLLISNGTFTINSADDSIHANGSVTVNGGSFEIASGDDAFHADNDLYITAGTINITKSYEGLEAVNIAVSGGDIKLVASDDGLNAAGGTDSSGTGGRDNGMFGGKGGMGGMSGMSGSSNSSIVISGGNLYINASGDGIDANGYLEITGGYTVVTGPTQGDTATLDYDTSAVISGGTFIGTGASTMAQSFSSSENQGVIAVSVGNQAAGTEIKLKNSSGKTIISHSPELSFGVVILSSPEIEKGGTYTVEVGSASKEFEAS